MDRKLKALIGEYIVDLYSADTPEAEFSLTDQYISGLGFDGLLYSFIPSIVIDKSLDIEPVFNTSEAYNNGYLEHYEQASFNENDYTIKKIVSGYQGDIDWWDEGMHQIIDSQEKSVFKVAREDYQLTNGISFATMANKTGFAGASLVCESKDSSYELLKKDSLETAKIIVRCYHNKVLANSKSREKYILPILDQLNMTDRKVLRYLLSHKTMSRVEDVTGISIYYANRVIERLREKLGGISKNELIYYAGLLNILEFIEG